ncbi:replication protein A 32 kDa subunit-like isoform X2 [Centruroides vittatus]|uniref:replication protein A 32 kDa subunit-like isoform X2 n=1 Tax=Centruroides vittatus TaxID=120091 RepID=UPI00350F1EDD
MSDFPAFSQFDSQSPSRSKNSGGFFYSPGKQGTPSPAKHGKQEFLQNIVPCTVAQLLKVTEEEESVKIGSIVANIITVVGKVHFVQKSTTQISFKLDDMSGPPINVKLWLNFNEDIPDILRLSSSFSYSRVIGKLRFIQGERFIHALKLLPIKDANEISMHLLEVIHVTMNQRVKESLSIDETNLMEVSSSKNTQNTSIKENVLGLSKPQLKVLQCICSNKTPTGASYDYLFSQLNTMNKHIIIETVEFLCNEGHVYNTIDDDHFKVTDEELF